MKNRILLLLSTVLLGTAALAQPAGRIGQHDPVGSWQNTSTVSSASEGKAIALQIMNAVGLKPNFEVVAANIPNAAAVVYGGKRYIVFNPRFINGLIQTTGTRWAAVSVLAHEIGHHLNGHTLTGGGSQPTLELDADEFSGFVLQKMGASLGEAQAAMRTIAQERASRTHPGQYDRLAAIQNGWVRAGGKPGADVAMNTPAPRPQQPPVRAEVERPAITASSIVGEIRFAADPSSKYYVTTRYNVVKVLNNQLSVIGKLSNSNNARYPYVIHDESTQLLVDRTGRILNSQGRLVGEMKAV
jgi:hypothetical protein